MDIREFIILNRDKFIVKCNTTTRWTLRENGRFGHSVSSDSISTQWLECELCGGKENLVGIDIDKEIEIHCICNHLDLILKEKI